MQEDSWIISGLLELVTHQAQVIAARHNRADSPGQHLDKAHCEVPHQDRPLAANSGVCQHHCERNVIGLNATPSHSSKGIAQIARVIIHPKQNATTHFPRVGLEFERNLFRAISAVELGTAPKLQSSRNMDTISGDLCELASGQSRGG